jgi:seryl-tRNA synthetase
LDPNYKVEKMDVFITLRIGMEKHMQGLVKGSAEYVVAKSELQKMEHAQSEMAKEHKGAVDGKELAYEHLANTAQALSGNVEAISRRLEGLEEKMEKMMSVIMAIE